MSGEFTVESRIFDHNSKPSYALMSTISGHVPETKHSLSLRGQNKAIASCMYSHWSEASPQWSS